MVVVVVVAVAVLQAPLEARFAVIMYREEAEIVFNFTASVSNFTGIIDTLSKLDLYLKGPTLVCTLCDCCKSELYYN